jgi:hypothetical protein
MLPLTRGRLFSPLHHRPLAGGCQDLWLVLAAGGVVASLVMLTAAGLAVTL